MSPGRVKPNLRRAEQDSRTKVRSRTQEAKNPTDFVRLDFFAFAGFVGDLGAPRRAFPYLYTPYSRMASHIAM